MSATARLLERTIGEYEIDTVIHLAAQTIVGIANRNPISTFESNIQGTWNLLEACRRVAAGQIDRDRFLRQGLRRSGEAALLRRHAAAGPASLRRQQDRCADLIAQTYAQDLRPAGGDHALRQFLRRRRSELEPHRARHHPLGPARRAAGDPLRRPVHPRLFLRGRRRRGLHAAGRAARQPAGTARRGVQLLQRDPGDGAATWCTAFCRRWVPRSSRMCATRQSTKSATSI